MSNRIGSRIDKLERVNPNAGNDGWEITKRINANDGRDLSATNAITGEVTDDAQAIYRILADGGSWDITVTIAGQDFAQNHGDTDGKS